MLVLAIVFYALLFGVAALFGGATGATAVVGTLLIPILYILYVIGISCITVKRLHDLGKPGTHFWLLLIPLYNVYLSLVLLFQKGITSANQYDGADPVAESSVPPTSNV